MISACSGHDMMEDFSATPKVGQLWLHRSIPYSIGDRLGANLLPSLTDVSSLDSSGNMATRT